MNPKQIITIAAQDWHPHSQLAHFERYCCQQPQVFSVFERLRFAEGFALVRQVVKSALPIWQAGHAVQDYLGCGFHFCQAPRQQLALPQLFSPKMNITSGYEFGGGIHHVNQNTPIYYVSLQFSADFIAQLATEQALPAWLVRLGQERGILDAISVPLKVRECAWQLCTLPADSLPARLMLESLALQWLSDALVLPAQVRPSRQIDDVIDILRHEYREPLTISLLAKRVGLNACYLKQQFKAHTGESIHQFLSRERLTQARHLLASRPDLSIKMVAALCGYRAAYFSQLFKKTYQQSPQQFRAFCQK